MLCQPSINHFLLKAPLPAPLDEQVKGLQINTCPFANLPERKRTQWALTNEEMKNCVWLKPELVAQIEFTAWTPAGHLRHSKVCGDEGGKAAWEVVLGS